MAHQVAVFGLGRFGKSLARELYRIGHDVLVVDRQEESSQEMVGQVTYAVTGDATSSALLGELGITHFDTAIVAMGKDMQSSILTTVLLKQQFKVAQVIARATSELHGRTLEAVGVDRVVYPEQETGVRTAHSIFKKAVTEYMELTDGFGFSKRNVTSDMVGKTIEQAGFTTLEDPNGASVIAINRADKPLLKPDQTEELQSGDILVIGGKEEILETP